MFFGKYLLEEKIISEKQLVDGMSEQMSSMPSLLKVFLDEGLLSSFQFIDIINEHIVSSKSILEIIKDNGHVSSDQLNKAITIQNDHKKSLIEILCEKKILASADCQNYIDAYLSKYDELCNSEKISYTVNDTIEQVSDVVKSSSDVEVSAAALESLKELGFSDEEALAELSGNVSNTSGSTPEEKIESESISTDSRSSVGYVKLFTEKKYKKLVKVSGIIKGCLDKGEEFSTYLSTLYKDFYTLKGSASLNNLEKSIGIFSSWENILENLFKYNNSELHDWMKSNHEKLDSSLNMLWEIRNNLSDGKGELDNDDLTSVLSNIEELAQKAA